MNVHLDWRNLQVAQKHNGFVMSALNDFERIDQIVQHAPAMPHQLLLR